MNLKKAFNKKSVKKNHMPLSCVNNQNVHNNISVRSIKKTLSPSSYGARHCAPLWLHYILYIYVYILCIHTQAVTTNTFMTDERLEIVLLHIVHFLHYHLICDRKLLHSRTYTYMPKMM